MVLFCKPRVCGEKPFLPKQHVPEPGITPAYAGKSKRRALPALSPGDHPRMCGEKAAPPLSAAKIGGSPPHVRGKASRLEYTTRRCRITPACAGKRFEEHGFVIGVWDHPRMCGEKHRMPKQTEERPGSPPHVRGKAVENKVNEPQFRITPACAGKSRVVQFNLSLILGSPPHVRGKEAQEEWVEQVPRITPACAGKV